MTAPDTKEPGTAIQHAPARETGMSEAGRRHLDDVRARNAMIVALNNESWGSKLSPIQARAFAEYMRRFNLDIREVDNLGGRPYRNGQYYKRRIMEMSHEGRIEWIRQYHIGPDSRLDELAAQGDDWAKKESANRTRARIIHAVPPTASHAYVVEVKLAALEEPLAACKWYIPGRTKLGWSKTERGKREQVSADPVGDENPVESVETRTWHRVGMIVAAEIPELRAEQDVLNAAEKATATAVATIAEEDMDREAEARTMLPARGTAGGALQAVNGYPGEEAEAVELPPATLHAMANAPDPMTGETPGEELVLGDLPVRTQRRSAQGEGR